MKYIEGGLCASPGFYANGLHCGVKTASPADKKDICLIYSDKPCTAAGVFTRNVVKAAPVLLSIKHLSENGGKGRAIIANSGNANCCAHNDSKNALKMAEFASTVLNVPHNEVFVASTGVIGQELNIDAIINAIPGLAESISSKSSDAAADAIMTTDTFRKEQAVEYEYDGVTIHIGGICKGSGMIHPNMGTMLAFVTTDAAICSGMLDKALRYAVGRSINRVTVDGDTSTNDTCIILANGASGAAEIYSEDGAFHAFRSALTALLTELAMMLAEDGEGAKHLITCKVSGTENDEQAEVLSKSVIGSSLVKTAVFGSDANWGRVICAMGYSGVDFDRELVSIAFESSAGRIMLCENGLGIPFDEDLAKRVLDEKRLLIDITAGSGNGEVVCWGCDLTYDYVRINGDYRT